MTQQSKMRAVRDGVERVIPYLFPALGGLFGVVYVNLNKMDQLNPMYWIGGGIIVGWLISRGLLWVMDRWL